MKLAKDNLVKLAFYGMFSVLIIMTIINPISKNIAGGAITEVGNINIPVPSTQEALAIKTFGGDTVTVNGEEISVDGIYGRYREIIETLGEGLQIHEIGGGDIFKAGLNSDYKPVVAQRITEDLQTVINNMPATEEAKNQISELLGAYNSDVQEALGITIMETLAKTGFEMDEHVITSIYLTNTENGEITKVQYANINDGEVSKVQLSMTDNLNLNYPSVLNTEEIAAKIKQHSSITDNSYKLIIELYSDTDFIIATMEFSDGKKRYALLDSEGEVIDSWNKRPSKRTIEKTMKEYQESKEESEESASTGGSYSGGGYYASGSYRTTVGGSYAVNQMVMNQIVSSYVANTPVWEYGPLEVISWSYGSSGYG